jgi:hypothetical protein
MENLTAMDLLEYVRSEIDLYSTKWNYHGSYRQNRLHYRNGTASKDWSSTA